MRRLSEGDRLYYAKHPDKIPNGVQCDRCTRVAVARGTDGHRAFALCADDMLAKVEARRAEPRVDALTRARAIQAATA